MTKSHLKELNILINCNNYFYLLKIPFNLDLIEPLSHVYVKSDNAILFFANT